MTSKPKALGLALIAVFAMSAVMASAAQATAGQFTGENYPNTITGTPTETLKTVTSAGSFTCANASTSFHGTLASASSSLTLTANYGGCLVGGLVPMVVDMKSCAYRFTIGKALDAPANDKIAGSVDIVCTTPGDEITTTIPSTGCVVHFPPQGPLAGITYTNNTVASPKDVDLDINVVTITYTQTAACIGGAQTKNNGTLTGKVTLKGEEETSPFAPRALTVDPET